MSNVGGVTSSTAFPRSQSVATDTPSAVMPIAELACFSLITSHTEYLWAMIDSMARKECTRGALFESYKTKDRNWQQMTWKFAYSQ